MARLIFHIDVNSAFLSWEATRRVSLGEEDIEKRKKIGFDYYQILAYLDYIKSLSCTSQVKRKALITIFVNRIYLYDDFFTLILNGGNNNLTIENIPLKNIENTFCSLENGTFLVPL